jgi:putative peptidoglycan lipid II flippase
MDEGPSVVPPDREPRRGTGIIRNTTIVAAFLFLGRVLGLAREFILGRYLGTTFAADVYRLGVDVVLQDIYAKFEKLLQPVYMPIFVERQRAEGDEEAFRFASVVGTVQGVALLALAAAGFLWAPQIVTAISADHESLAPGAEGFRLAVFFLRLMFPALVVFSLSNLMELTIQSYHHFTIPALAETVRRAMPVLGIVAAVVLLRPAEPVPTTYVLAVAVVAGVGLRFLIMLPRLWSKLRLVRPSLDLGNPYVRKAAVLVLPLILGVAFSYLRNLLEAYFALGEGEGAFAALKYARKIVDMPWQILGLAVSFVIYPYISELGAAQDRDRMADALVSMVRAMMYVFVPTTIFFLILGEPTIRVAFQGVRFDEDSVWLTHSALPWYLVGMVFFAIEDPMLKWFFALSDTKTPVILGIVGDFIWFGIAYVGVRQMGLGLPALAFAMSGSKALKVLILLLILRPRLGEIKRERVVPFLGKLAVTAVVMAGAVVIGSRLLPKVIPFGGLPGHAANLLGCFIVALAVYVPTSFVLRIEECSLVAERVRTGLRRGHG